MAEMWITMGPQHPMTHGLWTLRVKVDGETVTDTEAELGYIHRGVEKICEARDFTQITPCLLYTSPSPRDTERSRMPSSA